MRSYLKQFRHLLLGLATCFAVVVFCAPSFSYSFPEKSAQASQLERLDSEFSVSAANRTNIQIAKSILLAQGMDTFTSYVAPMTESNVVGSSPGKTPARGAVGAVLSGNRLIVRGSFKMLTSDMRNYASDPVNPPNSDITSAFHIHQGTQMENGPFQYALTVMLDDNGRSGSAMGEYTLTQEQMQALADNRLYVDIHTTKNRGGELRGTLMPY
jgi:hypothetical protein